MKRKFVLLVPVILMLFISGCTDGPVTTFCSDEGLAIVSYNVNPLERVYPGYTVNIDFYLENKGSYDATDVEVAFFDIPGFELDSIHCEDGSGIESGCKIGRIKTNENCFGDKKKISATLIAVDPGERTISFSVNYKYGGNSKLLFSVWDQDTTKEQWGKTERGSGHGPVKVDINTDFLLRRIIDDQEETVTEWIEEGQRFTVTMDIREVGNTQYETFEKTMKPGDFEVYFDHVSIYDTEHCDFSGNTLKEEVEYPTKKPLMCDMQANDDIGDDWVAATIEVDYTYEYGLVKKQNFEILE